MNLYKLLGNSQEAEYIKSLYIPVVNYFVDLGKTCHKMMIATNYQQYFQLLSDGVF